MPLPIINGRTSGLNRLGLAGETPVPARNSAQLRLIVPVNSNGSLRE
jgi:hypothetical protein